MKKLVLVLAVLCLTFALPEQAEAQFFQSLFKKSPQRSKVKSRKKRSSRVGSYAGSKSIRNPQISYFTAGGGINSLNYFGDLAPNPRALSTDISFTRPAINLSFGQKFGDRYYWRTNFMWGRMSGSDFESANLETVNANRHLRNHQFRNDIQELSFFMYYDFIRHAGNYQSRPPLVPYAFIGLSVFHHNPKGLVPEYFYLNENPNSAIALDAANTWVSLHKLGTGGQKADQDLRDEYRNIYGRDLPSHYSRVQIAIPVGLGVKYKINKDFEVALELSYRHLFTNYMDDMGGSLYVDPSAFLKIYEGDLDKAYTAMAMADRSMELYHYYQQTEGLDFQNVGERIYNNRINNVRLEFDEDGILDGYRRHAGYGADSYSENPDTWNMRGNPNNNDMFFVTNIRLTYIIGKSFTNNAKFR